MIKEIIEKWEENKGKLEEYFKNTPQTEYHTYLDIVKSIVKYVLGEDYDYKDVCEIEQGSYQGIQVYIIKEDGYGQDFLYTHNYYGSCSGCDTLRSILYQIDDNGGFNNEGKPTKSQLKQYMELSLHLIQKMKKLEMEE